MLWSVKNQQREISEEQGFPNDPLVPLNLKGFDPQIFLNDPDISLFTLIHMKGGHCDPLNRKPRENPGRV